MCDCIERANKALEGTNTMLVVPGVLNRDTGEVTYTRLLVATMKRDSRSREQPRPMVATYCPFCGKEYADG